MFISDERPLCILQPGQITTFHIRVAKRKMRCSFSIRISGNAASKQPCVVTVSCAGPSLLMCGPSLKSPPPSSYAHSGSGSPFHFTLRPVVTRHARPSHVEVYVYVGQTTHDRLQRGRWLRLRRLAASGLRTRSTFRSGVPAQKSRICNSGPRCGMHECHGPPRDVHIYFASAIAHPLDVARVKVTPLVAERMKASSR